MGAAQPEVDELDVAGGQPAARRLRGDGCLERDLVEREGLHQLGLGDGCGDLQQRLVGQDHPPLRNGIDVAGEPKGAEPVHGLGGKPGVGHPGEVLVGEAERLEVVEAVLEPGGDEEAATRRQPPDEETERGQGHHAPAQVACRHVEFVEVGDEACTHCSSTWQVLPRSAVPITRLQVTDLARGGLPAERILRDAGPSALGELVVTCNGGRDRRSGEVRPARRWGRCVRPWSWWTC